MKRIVDKLKSLNRYFAVDMTGGGHSGGGA
jgi:hypothetical protein